MPAAYKFFAELAQTWGLLYFVAVFLVVLVYALAPSRKARFDEAAHMPLKED
jgi:cytochrome c oxidase cbb3-type subunit 4